MVYSLSLASLFTCQLIVTEVQCLQVVQLHEGGVLNAGHLIIAQGQADHTTNVGELVQVHDSVPVKVGSNAGLGLMSIGWPLCRLREGMVQTPARTVDGVQGLDYCLLVAGTVRAEITVLCGNSRHTCHGKQCCFDLKLKQGHNPELTASNSSHLLYSSISSPQ